MSNWEQGLTRPDVDTLTKICQILNVSADEMLDLRLPWESYTVTEQRIIERYRQRPELRLAIHILLDVKPMPSTDEKH